MAVNGQQVDLEVQVSNEGEYCCRKKIISISLNFYKTQYSQWHRSNKYRGLLIGQLLFEKTLEKTKEKITDKSEKHVDNSICFSLLLVTVCE